MKKSQRHAAILDLVQKHTVRTQEELLKQLEGMGFDATQATVSRDIRELKIVKVSDGGGGYRYSTALPLGDGDFAQKLKKIFAEAVYKADFAGNIVVLKTYAGMGNAAGAAVDSMQLDGVVGTLAGDDTMLIVARTEESAEKICSRLKTMIFH